MRPSITVRVRRIGPLRWEAQATWGCAHHGKWTGGNHVGLSVKYAVRPTRRWAISAGRRKARRALRDHQMRNNEPPYQWEASR